MNNVVNLNQLNQLMSDTYIDTIIEFLAAIAIAFIVSTIVPWQGRKDKSYITRRIAFIIIGIVAVLGFWLYNDQMVASHIRGAGFVNMFKDCNLKCIGITTGGYLLISGILMCVFRNSKFASIIFKIKGK